MQRKVPWQPDTGQADLVFSERGTLTAGHGSRMMVHAIDCDCGGSAARSSGTTRRSADFEVSGTIGQSGRILQARGQAKGQDR